MTLNPPKKIRKPSATTICINNFFLSLSFIAKYEKTNSKIPKKLGISDVTELLPLTNVTINPHRNKNIPYFNEIVSIFFPNTVYSNLSIM